MTILPRLTPLPQKLVTLTVPSYNWVKKLFLEEKLMADDRIGDRCWAKMTVDTVVRWVRCRLRLWLEDGSTVVEVVDENVDSPLRGSLVEREISKLNFSDNEPPLV